MEHPELAGATRIFTDPGTSMARLDGRRYSTHYQPAAQRLEWLREVIGREWADVDITVPRGQDVFNDILIYPWRDGMRLSPIRSNPVCLSRVREPLTPAQDCYNLVVLTSGKYRLEQDDREVYLKPGDMTLYDVTRPHRITIPVPFSKILISIPKKLLARRIGHCDELTATRLPVKRGMGAVTSTLIQSTVNELGSLHQEHYMELANPVLDLVSLTAGAMSGRPAALTQHRRLLLDRLKSYIKLHLQDSELDAAAIAAGMGLSVRYINNLFHEEETSLMRYVTTQRLELSRRRLASSAHTHESVTSIAMQCGFNSMAHFSRAFKQAYGVSPRAYRQSGSA